MKEKPEQNPRLYKKIEAKSQGKWQVIGAMGKERRSTMAGVARCSGKQIVGKEVNRMTSIGSPRTTGESG